MHANLHHSTPAQNRKIASHTNDCVSWCGWDQYSTPYAQICQKVCFNSLCLPLCVLHKASFFQVPFSTPYLLYQQSWLSWHVVRVCSSIVQANFMTYFYETLNIMVQYIYWQLTCFLLVFGVKSQAGMGKTWISACSSNRFLTMSKTLSRNVKDSAIAFKRWTKGSSRKY